MEMMELPVMKEFLRMCNDGWLQGWHERNSGNLTYRMRAEEVAKCRPCFSADTPWNKMQMKAENVAGQFFIATGSGNYFRNVVLQPQNNLCVVEINDAGDAWRNVWGMEQGGQPTSELQSHVYIQSVRMRATNGECRVAYHAHPTHVIALTYVLPLEAKAFTRVLWQSATECAAVFPQGIGVVPWMAPGTFALAQASGPLMQEYEAVVWAHHGLFCTGKDFDTAFGLMHTLEKAAEIYVRTCSCGQGIRQTITDDHLREMAKALGLTLNEAFLE